MKSLEFDNNQLFGSNEDDLQQLEAELEIFNNNNHNTLNDILCSSNSNENTSTCNSSGGGSENNINNIIVSEIVLQAILNRPIIINGKEFCLVEKEVYMAENCLKRALECDYSSSSSSSSTSNSFSPSLSSSSSTTSENDECANVPSPAKRKKGVRLRKEYPIEGTNVSFIVHGHASFHTVQDVFFVDKTTNSSVGFRLLKGFVNGEEKKAILDENSDNGSSVKLSPFKSTMKVGSSTTFNCKIKGIYRFLFELECFKDKHIEWTVETLWKGYEKTKSFKSLDVLSSKVQIVNL